ncbi:hypothetical protein AAMO2058_001108500 [Amorphochlora amoebiformis]
MGVLTRGRHWQMSQWLFARLLDEQKERDRDNTRRWNVRRINISDSYGKDKNRLDAAIFNAGITAATAGIAWEKALTIAQEMDAQGIQRDIVTVNSLITALSRGGVADKGVELAKSTLAGGIRVQVHTLGAALSACHRATDWQLGISILDECENRGFRLNNILITTAIAACDRGKKWQMALSLFRSLSNPSSYSYGAATSACNTGKKWAMALSFMKHMKRAGIQHSEGFTSSSIACFNHAVQWQRALSLALSALHRIQNPGITGDSRRVSSDLEIGGDANGASTDLLICNSGIHACERGIQWKKAMEILRIMQLKNIIPNQATYQSLTNALSQASRPDLALNITLEAVNTGDLPLDASLYGSILHCCAQARQWQKALTLLRDPPPSPPQSFWIYSSSALAALLYPNPRRGNRISQHLRRLARDLERRLRGVLKSHRKVMKVIGRLWVGGNFGMGVYVGGGVGLGGGVKETWSDFIVREIPKGETEPLHFRAKTSRSEESSEMRRVGKPDESNSKYWSLDVGKVRTTTFEAVEQIARKFKIKPETIYFAGMKDFQGCTLQRFTVPNAGAVSRKGIKRALISKRVKIYSAHPTDTPLGLGELSGNRFTIIIRNITIPKFNSTIPPHSAEANVNGGLRDYMEKICRDGFINFFGDQRFTGFAGNHFVGAAYLHRQYRRALYLMLLPKPLLNAFPNPPRGSPREESLEDLEKSLGNISDYVPSLNPKEAQGLESWKAVWLRTKVYPNYQNARNGRNNGRNHLNSSSEKDLSLRCSNQTGEEGSDIFPGDEWCRSLFLTLPFPLRLLMIHSYNSRVWNLMANVRISTGGITLVKGDIVYPRNFSRDDKPSDLQLAREYQGPGKTGTCDGTWRMRNLVLPMNGGSVMWPRENGGRAGASVLLAEGTASIWTVEKTKKGNLHFITGGYRFVIGYPENASWKVISYDKHQKPTNGAVQGCLLTANDVPKTFRNYHAVGATLAAEAATRNAMAKPETTSGSV